jgi:hypothetical protein
LFEPRGYINGFTMPTRIGLKARDFSSTGEGTKAQTPRSFGSAESEMLVIHGTKLSAD